jgi:hypothetical protein
MKAEVEKVKQDIINGKGDLLILIQDWWTGLMKNIDEKYWVSGGICKYSPRSYRQQIRSFFRKPVSSQTGGKR